MVCAMEPATLKGFKNISEYSGHPPLSK